MCKYLKISAAVAAALVLCSCGEIAELDAYMEFSETTEEEYEESLPPQTLDISGIPDLPKLNESSKDTATEAVEVPETEAPQKTEDKLIDKNISLNAEDISENLYIEKTADNSLPKPDRKAAGCIEVPYRSQDDLPTGCELVSTSMLLKFYGFETEPLDLIDDGYVLKSEFEKDGSKIYGGDPNYAFIGDPKSKSGYGCYSGAIYDGLCRFLENDFYDTYYLSGMSLNDICNQYIDFGEPVVIWGSIGMGTLYYDDSSSWVIKDTGEEFSWLSNEHCMVLVGYDDYYYYIHDPLKGAYTPYERELADMRFAEMGYQAVTIRPW